jgi:hypothetical protein
MLTTVKQIKRSEIINFFVVEKGKDIIHYGKIDWEKDKILLDGEEVSDVTVEKFFDKIDYDLVDIFLTKLDAMNRKNDFRFVSGHFE